MAAQAGQAMLQDASLTPDEYWAASVLVQAHKLRQSVDQHIASVLAGYVRRKQRVNRWGK